MEYYLDPPAGWFSPLELLLHLIHRFSASLAVDRRGHWAKPDNREAVNRQAERMLTDYGNSILRLAYSYLHNLSDAEDVLQDTLIQFLKTGPILKTTKHEKAWLLRVAANLSKNRLD